jgi:hypothetical protein
MQIDRLKPAFERLQRQYGSRRSRAIYGAGCTDQPAACFVFMNPTARNVAARPDWRGIRAPWIGTKIAWRLFEQVGMLGAGTLHSIEGMSSMDWDEGFAENVYLELAARGAYVTNLCKATQDDARPLSDRIFREYLPLLLEEIAEIRPKVVFAFGNQVGSIIFGRTVKVSDDRRKMMPIPAGGSEYPGFAVHYPVGQGLRNMGLAVSDIKMILRSSIAQRLNRLA